MHIAWKKKVKPEALSRRPDHSPTQFRSILICLKGLHDQFCATYTSDSLAIELLSPFRYCTQPASARLVRSLSNLKLFNEHLYWTATYPLMVYILAHTIRSEFVEYLHGVEHLDGDNIYCSTVNSIYWPQIYWDILQSVRNCCTCQSKKPSITFTNGIRKPLPITKPCSEMVKFDIAAELPHSGVVHDAALVFFDNRSRHALSVPTYKGTTTNDSMKLSMYISFRWRAARPCFWLWHQVKVPVLAVSHAASQGDCSAFLHSS